MDLKHSMIPTGESVGRIVGIFDDYRGPVAEQGCTVMPYKAVDGQSRRVIYAAGLEFLIRSCT